MTPHFTHNGSSFYTNLPEKELWDLFLKGEREAYAAMFQIYYPALINYGLKIIRDKPFVEDTVQDLFIELWNKKEGLGKTDSIKYYLFRSVRRKIVHALKTTNPTASEEGAFNYFEMVLPYENELINAQMEEEKKQQLVNAINKLTKRQKEAIYLRYYEHMESSEVAEVMGLNVNSTYVLLSQAIDALKKYMEQLGVLVILSRILGL